jgi:hypothetical protein
MFPKFAYARRAYGGEFMCFGLAKKRGCSTRLLVLLVPCVFEVDAEWHGLVNCVEKVFVGSLHAHFLRVKP